MTRYYESQKKLIQGKSLTGLSGKKEEFLSFNHNLKMGQWGDVIWLRSCGFLHINIYMCTICYQVPSLEPWRGCEGRVMQERRSLLRSHVNKCLNSERRTFPDVWFVVCVLVPNQFRFTCIHEEIWRRFQKVKHKKKKKKEREKNSKTCQFLSYTVHLFCLSFLFSFSRLFSIGDTFLWTRRCKLERGCWG